MTQEQMRLLWQTAIKNDLGGDTVCGMIMEKELPDPYALAIEEANEHWLNGDGDLGDLETLIARFSARQSVIALLEAAESAGFGDLLMGWLRRISAVVAPDII